MSSIYRFKFSPEFSTLLNNFAKIHEYDEQKDFKEAWEKWTEYNTDEIEKEENTHIDAGYKGNILDKAYRSARYYYRKKKTIDIVATKRSEYLYIEKDILKQMDEHINNNLKCKPSISFEDYYTSYFRHDRNECSREEEETRKSKFKKTYKNRCYMINKKNIQQSK